MIYSDTIKSPLLMKEFKLLVREPSSWLPYALLNNFFAPIFLLFPIMFSSILASYSFSGEKFEGTLEGLLMTPLTIHAIARDKLLSVLIPSIIVSWLCVIVYIISCNIFGAQKFDGIIMVNWQWVFILAIAPLFAFCSVALVILVSQRARSIKSAQAVALIGVIPVIGVMVSQSFGAFIIGPLAIFLTGVVLCLIDVVLLWILGKIDPAHLILNR